MLLIKTAYINEFHLLLLPTAKGMKFICQLWILHQKDLHTLCIILHHITSFKVKQVLPQIGTSHIGLGL